MLASVPTLVLAGESPVPPTSGIRLRVLHLTRALAARHEVTLGVLGPPPAGIDAEPFTLAAAGEMRGRARSLATALTRPYDVAKHAHPALGALAASRSWDVVQAELPYLLGPAARAGAPVVLDAHNVESHLLEAFADSATDPLRRARWRWEAAKMRRWEAAWAPRVAAVAVTSDADAAAFEALGAREVVVVPNGVDASAIAFRPPPASSEVVYTGHFGYRPNALAALELATAVLRAIRGEQPLARLVLAGRDPGPELRRLAGPSVEVTGPVPEVEPFLRRARVTVLPLRAGSGTRLKALEAMAAGVPVVSTALGVAGLRVRDGEHVLIAETPEELGRAAARVIADDALAHGLAERARALVERVYDWPVVSAPLLELHARLAR